MALGLQGLALNRIPDKWDKKWFADFVREALALADTRNAQEGPGIVITGQPSEPATISASDELNDLLEQPFILAGTSGFLDFERVLASGDAITITDNGPNSTIEVGIGDGDIALAKLAPQPALSVLGNQLPDTGPVSNITGSTSGDVLRVRDVGGGTLNVEFSPLADDPGAVIGLTEIPGTSIYAMRADAAPALDQGIVPTWTGLHTFNVTPVVPNDSWTYAKIQNAAALSVLGRSANSIGELGDIVASVDGDVLRRSGTTVGFGDVVLRASNFANPSASLGLTAVNGSAITAMRSDAAPALDQGIAPTWTSTHKWTDNDEVQLGTGGDLRLLHDGTNSIIRNDTGALNILRGDATVMLSIPQAGAITTAASWTFTSSTTGSLSSASGSPNWVFSETDQTTDEKNYIFLASNKVWRFDMLNDALGGAKAVIRATRGTGVVLSQLDFGNATDNAPYNFLGTGVVTSGGVHRGPDGSASAPTYSFSSSGNDDNGMYLSAANEVSFASAGSQRILIDSAGRFAGKALHNNASSPTGTTNQYVASGTYTPTLTNVTNVSASTARQCQWLRVGNVVQVGGQLDVDPTAAGAVEVGISLPLASAFTTAFQCGGDACASAIAGQSAAIDADATNDRARLRWVAVDITNQPMMFTFTYEVL